MKIRTMYGLHLYFKWLLVFLVFQRFGMVQVYENQISLRK